MHMDAQCMLSSPDSIFSIRTCVGRDRLMSPYEYRRSADVCRLLGFAPFSRHQVIDSSRRTGLQELAGA